MRVPEVQNVGAGKAEPFLRMSGLGKAEGPRWVPAGCQLGPRPQAKRSPLYPAAGGVGIDKPGAAAAVLEKQTLT